MVVRLWRASCQRHRRVSGFSIRARDRKPAEGWVTLIRLNQPQEVLVARTSAALVRMLWVVPFAFFVPAASPGPQAASRVRGVPPCLVQPSPVQPWLVAEVPWLRTYEAHVGPSERSVRAQLEYRPKLNSSTRVLLNAITLVRMKSSDNVD